MTPMTIRYAKWLAISCLVVGVLTLVVALLTGELISIFAGVVLTVLGALMLVNPFVKIEPHEVQLRSPLGFVGRRFAVSSPADLRIDGKAVRLVEGNKKVINLGFGIDKADAAALRAQLQQTPPA